MGWVTLEDGQHIFIGPGGRVEPSGPGSAVSTRRSRKAGQVVQAAREEKARTIKRGLAKIARNRHERAKIQAGIRTQRNAKRAQRHADTAAAEQAAAAQAAKDAARAARSRATRSAADAARAERAGQPTRFTSGSQRRADQAARIRAQRQAGSPHGVVAAIRANVTTTRGTQIRTYGTPAAITRRSELVTRARQRDTDARVRANVATSTRSEAIPPRPAPAASPQTTRPARGAGYSQTPNAIRTREQRAQRAQRALEAAKAEKRDAHPFTRRAAEDRVAEARRTRDAAVRLKRAGRAAAAAAAPAAAPAGGLGNFRLNNPAAAARNAEATARQATAAALPTRGDGLIAQRTTNAFEHATMGATQNARVRINPNAHALAKRWFGSDVTPEHIASLTGAPDNARVNISSYGDRIQLSVDHPTLTNMDRTIRRDADGQVRIHNDLFRAAGHEGGYNGYMTWARFGYDAPLTSQHREQIRARPELAEHHNATRISDLMTSQAGRDYWRDKGTWTQMTFDLSKGSRSMQALDKYLKYRQEESARPGGRAMSVGLNAFARQVENAHKMGVHSIDTSAARS